MEKAIYIVSIDNVKDVSVDYSRIYFGHEFCEKLLPTWNEIKNVLTFCIQNNYDFSFVTSYVSNEGLDKLKLIFENINNMEYECEIIINDWGVMNYILDNKDKFIYLKPILGRLLSKISKSPRMRNIYDNLNYYQKEALGKFNYSFELVNKFFLEKGIKRYEIDNVYQDIHLSEKMMCSLYYPYVFISTTKNCNTAGVSLDLELKRGKDNCAYECKIYKFKLKHPIIEEGIICKGNTYYYRNENIMQKLSNNQINRLVYQVEI
ncbi:hypothetical protein [Clostridium sp. BL-8]|uniref:hypothetical protein n=1 Tax=Clostridium sp. BL-8 TaxID=349938 RepID=UPI00098C1187|nr:hypothetical protein [Clostridium sp. BL-8]OOM77109.1 hypothetical protein CLOBL_31120 [Clostridium sp. BL-8]